MTPDEELRRRNVRMGLTLAGVAVAFFVGFILRRYWLMGHG